jgi:hypothetical protein
MSLSNWPRSSSTVLAMGYGPHQYAIMLNALRE